MESIKFDWSEFSAEKYARIKGAKSEGNEYDTDYYEACVRVGDLCFDVVLTECIGDGNVSRSLFYYLYVGGIDSGYGYSSKEGMDGYPYDQADRGPLPKEFLDLPYEEFKLAAENFFTKCIAESEYNKQCDLLTKAAEPLKVW